MLTKRTKRHIKRCFKLHLRNRSDYLADRASLAVRVAYCAEGGKVALVSSGMDCDCSRWENAVTLVQAIPAAVMHRMERDYADAEGPLTIYVERPSVAAGLTETHRDLALEAFEEGRPHFIHP